MSRMEHINQRVAQYRRELLARNFENNEVKKAKLELLNYLMQFDDSPGALPPLEQIKAKIAVLERIQFGRGTGKALSNSLKTLEAGFHFQFNQSSFIKNFIDGLLKLFGLQPYTHFDDIIRDAKQALEDQKAALDERQALSLAVLIPDPEDIESQAPQIQAITYTPQDIATAVHFTSSKLIDNNHRDVLGDFYREVKLGDRDTQGKSDTEIEAEIAAFTQGHPAVHEFINTTPGQGMAAALEKELLASYVIPAGYDGLTKTSDIRWIKEGNRFFCDVNVAVISVERMRDSSQMVFPIATIASTWPRLEALDQTGKEALIESRTAKEAIDPVLSASMRVELTVDPRGAVVPKVKQVAVISHVADLRRAAMQTYSAEQRKAVDISDLPKAMSRPPEGSTVASEVLTDFDRGAALVIDGKEVKIPSFEGDHEEHRERVAKGVRILTGETNPRKGFARIINTTAPQGLLAPLRTELVSAIPELGPPKQIKTIPHDMRWSMERGALYYEATLKVVGVLDPAAETGQVVDPVTRSLTTVPDSAYNGLVSEKSAAAAPIAEARVRMKFTKNPAGGVGLPEIVELSIINHYPAATATPAVAQPAGPPWARVAGTHPHTERRDRSAGLDDTDEGEGTGRHP